MKCPSCGAETNSEFCEYCGSELPENKTNIGVCPKCGSNSITFRREQTGTEAQHVSRGNMIGTRRKGRYVSQFVYRTVGICKNCGFTWNPNEKKNSGRKTWLWVLGWICIFPVPLTILLLRKKEMKPVIKYGIIAIAWLIYIAIAVSGSGTTEPSQEDATSHIKTEQIEQTMNDNNNETCFLTFIKEA